MTLRLTPLNLIAAYDYLKTTAPFNKWKLPHADDLEFHVTDHADRYGHILDFPDARKKYLIIAVSVIKTNTTCALLETIAHEMCHLKQRRDRGYRARGQGHGPTFKRLAKDVCRSHGFDPKTF